MNTSRNTIERDHNTVGNINLFNFDGAEYEQVEESNNPGNESLWNYVEDDEMAVENDDECDHSNGDHHHHKTASLASCSVHLLNTLAGTGMLGLPSAYSSSGFVVGTILLIFAAFFSALGLHLLVVSAATVQARNRNSSSSPSASFYSVATAAMPEFAVGIDLAIAIKCFGVSIGYFITVGDCMTDAFRYILRNIKPDSETIAQEIEEAVFSDRHFWIVCAFIMVLPISFFKSLDKLKFTSTLSLVLIYAMAICIVLYAEGVFDPCLKYYYAAIEGDDATRIVTSFIDRVAPNLDLESCQGSTFMVTTFESTLANLSIFIFSFTCHQNIFAVVNELKRPTRRRVSAVVATAVGCALILYLTVAVEGYRTFGDSVKGNILLNYPQTGLVTMMRIGITIMVIFSYPLQLDPSRRCLTSLIHYVIDKREKERQRQEHERLTNSNRASDSSGDQDELGNDLLDQPGDQTISSNNQATEIVSLPEETDDLLDKFIFNGITILFLIFSFMIAESVKDLGTILGLVGATGSTMVSYILPASIYIKLHGGSHFLGKLARVQLFLGITIMPTALYFVIFRGSGE
jgi:amino acid permease